MSAYLSVLMTSAHNTTQNSLIIFQTNIVAPMLSIGGERGVSYGCLMHVKLFTRRNKTGSMFAADQHHYCYCYHHHQYYHYCYLNILCPTWGRGAPFPPLSLHFPVFCSFLLFLFLGGFNYFLLLSIPFLFTRIVPLRFQAGGRIKRPNLGLVCCV